MQDQSLSAELLLPRKSSLLNLSVEEENLASIPFAVLEQRVGKRVGKLEVSGSKTLPGGTEVQVTWQVQGNNELGLPTEHDLDIFMALGVLTFRNNFAKTVSFHGREIARILNISSVHGKFYDRLKVAMDRFIPLRFRALTQSDRHEDVKWMNVFQEASFSLDRETGRCVGTITWTDKIIQAMDNGFFRLLDANRYMELDGLTAKHMYRFLAVAFETDDVVIIDARKLAVRHLGILNPPKYLSRLMQTLEPALEQLRQAEVVGSWHVVSKAEWRIAIRCAPNYVPERKVLCGKGAVSDPAFRRQQCQQILEKAGLEPEEAALYCQKAAAHEHFYALERAAHLLTCMGNEQVHFHVAAQIVRKALDAGPGSDELREALDWIEIGLAISNQKRNSRKSLRNAAGLIVKLARDTEARQRLVSADQAKSWQEGFRRREAAALRQHQEHEERSLLLEYEQHREAEARKLFAALPEESRYVLQQQKAAQLKGQDRYQRLSADQQAAEIEYAVLADMANQHVPLFEKWRLRRMARQAMLPFFQPAEAIGALGTVAFGA